MRATVFTLSLLETGRPLGHALVCPEARYATIAWRRNPEPERRQAPPHIWKEVEAEYFAGIPGVGPLEASGGISRLLLAESVRTEIALQRFAELRLTPSDPKRTTGALDAALLGLLIGHR